MKRVADPDDHPPGLRLRFRSDLAEVRPKVARVRNFLINAGFLEEHATECESALVEACTNAIQHASAEGKRHPVMIEARITDGWLEFRVTDHTRGFDWPGKSVLPDPNSESGRGIFLIQSLMTTTEYLCGKDGNVLVMRRQFRQ